MHYVTIGSGLGTSLIVASTYGRATLAEGPAPEPLVPLEMPSQRYLMPEFLYEAAVFEGALPAAKGAEPITPIVAGDTVRYRICKDLTVCYIDFAAPAPGIATPLLPLQIASPNLFPVEVLAIAPAPPARWLLLGVPLLGLASVLHRGGQDFVPEPPLTPLPHGTIPEPGSLLLLATGVAGVRAWRRRPGARREE